MTVAYFDCFSGISGDMVLGALVDAGVPFDELRDALANLPIEGYEITCRRVQRCGIGGTQVQVRLTGHDHGHGHDHDHDHNHSHDHDHKHSHSHSHSHEHPHTHDHSHEHSHSHEHTHAHEHPHDHEHSHSHTHAHDHDHAHDHHHHDHPHDHEHTHSHDHHHDHSHDHSHSHGHHHHRGLSEIRGIIEASSFSQQVKQRAVAAFLRIAQEEAAVHETTIEEVHFHEVGAVDAIVDIVGSMWCIERLGITRVRASPVAVGSGTIHVAHGEMPIPAPATARLLRGKPICTGPVSGELTTPTGAAILTTLAEYFGPLENFAIDKVAYGAGTREYPSHTNYLRVLLGEVQNAASAPGASLPLIRENLLLVTAEIDDMPAELLGAAMEKLMAAGALDCHFVPVQMKKNRPAVSLHLLCDSGSADTLLEIVFRHTTTLGVKVLPCERLSLKRESKTIQTSFGEVRLKAALWGEETLRRVPEFSDCAALAAGHGVPVLTVYQAAIAAAVRDDINEGNRL